jgi:hypothetical protein
MPNQTLILILLTLSNMSFLSLPFIRMNFRWNKPGVLRLACKFANVLTRKACHLNATIAQAAQHLSELLKV